MFRTEILPAPPDASVLWLCEPDTSGHYDGLGSAGQLAALRAADAAFGRLMDDWRAGPWAEDLQVMVDYNQSLSVPEAIGRVQLLEEEALVWVEEPTRADDFAGHAR